jgi:hypothetical protein
MFFRNMFLISITSYTKLAYKTTLLNFHVTVFIFFNRSHPVVFTIMAVFLFPSQHNNIVNNDNVIS